VPLPPGTTLPGGEGGARVQPFPLAASVAVAAPLSGPPRRVEVAAVTTHAVYLSTDDPQCPALCLADPAAVRVPCALVAARTPHAVTVGDVGTVGTGALTLASFEARVARWWRPPRPRGLLAEQLRAVARELRQRLPAPPDADADAAVNGLVRALATGASPTGDVMRLLGSGPGLTPLGDDVLAGALVTLAALGSPAFVGLGAAVRTLAPARTTFVSAALLHHAARGECVPQLHALLTAGRRGCPVAGAVDALLDIGDTSGTGLGHGVLAALAATSQAPALSGEPRS
jgi:hypothetical protein